MASITTHSSIGQNREAESLEEIRILPGGGITSPQGFMANGIHAGIKKKKKDLTVLCSEQPATVAAVFTVNTVKAAPVLWSQAVLAHGRPIRGIVVNSGNANACTGEQGMTHARQMAEITSACLQCAPDEVMVASTGVIGLPLTMEPVIIGIERVAHDLRRDAEAARHAAEAIMTTDTFTKEIAVTFELDGIPVTIAAMAKGSGMIHPNMATMLAFVTTDAAISRDLLEKALTESVEASYHMISVDGDTSTNDMVAILANGMAENPPIVQEDANYEIFCAALDRVNQEMARLIARDGEGATKFLTAVVENAPDISQARTLAKAIISSSLVKSAAFGQDANWGRVLAAMGATGLDFDPERVSLSLSSPAGRLLMLDRGQPVPFDELFAKMILQECDIDILVDLDAGACRATAWGCDLTHDYVTINSSYRS